MTKSEQKGTQSPPRRLFYQIAQKINFQYKVNPFYVLQNPFKNSAHIQHDKLKQMRKACNKDQMLINYCISKLYCLQFTPKSFKKVILEKISQLWRLKKLSAMFSVFKYTPTFIKIRQNIDPSSPLFITAQQTPVNDPSQLPQQKKKLIQKKKTVSIRINHKQTIQSMVNVINSDRAKWKKIRKARAKWQI